MQSTVVDLEATYTQIAAASLPYNELVDIILLCILTAFTCLHQEKGLECESH